MGQKMYNVTIQGITKQYPEKIPYSEIVKEYEGSTDAPVMLVIVNGRLRELHKHLKADCEIEFVTSKDPIGHKTYCRSASLILLKAIYDVAGQENIDSVVIHYSVGSGYYFTMKGPMALDQEFIDKVKTQMHRIVDENLPIVKRSVSTSEAVALFHKHHMYDKEKLFNYRRSSAVNLYSIGSFEDYFYGFMANHTGYIKTFDLFLYEGGFVLQLPTQNEPDRIPEFKPREKIFRVQKESQEWGDKLDIAMRYFQKLLCLLILVLAASFGVGGCVLLYSDFSVQRSRMAAANAAAHAQACTLLQTEILDLQRRGISTGDAALTARVTAQNVPAALWRGDTLVCATLEGLQSLPLGDAATVTVRTENSIYAVYASDLQGGLRLVTAYDLTGLYRDRNAALMRFLLLEAAVLAAASAVTALLARRLTRPLAVLTDAGAQIAAGDYARRTDLHTGDEIEALSRSFDKMADAVQEKIADLEADVQRREDFVGAFTHELKTPMTSIIGYADMLHTMQTDPDEQREAAAAIVHEGRRLEALSRKLLALLGLNEEGVELTAVPLPALWPRLHAACPDVTLRTPTAAPTVRGDADLLLDLLCNLVQNAAKASAPGAPVLVLCAQAGDAVTLTVADRGCGIPPELIPRVTEPFFMVDKSRARRQGGSGLGLALCQRIAAAHGSALRIESEPGRGTRVSVTLPVWKEDAP